MAPENGMDLITLLIKAPACLVILFCSLGMSLYAYYGNPNLFGKLILHPHTLKQKGSWFTLLSSGFLHGDITHLILNMLTLCLFGFDLEANVGTLQFAMLYFGTVIFSNSALFYLYKTKPKYFSLGASGALFAVVVCHILREPQYTLHFLNFNLYVPGNLYIGIYISYIYFAVRQRIDNVSHEPQLAGALAGLVFSLVHYPGLLKANFLNF